MLMFRPLLAAIMLGRSLSFVQTARWGSGTRWVAQNGSSSCGTALSSTANQNDSRLINLSSVTQSELETLISAWGFPRYRADQVWQWIRGQGVTDVDQMTNLPKKLRAKLGAVAKPSSLSVAFEALSKDGTIKRAYECEDGQVIESVLMPYEDGRYTACISSQAGCAQGCVFCATGQMGFSRQLSSAEIFEQVSRYASLLRQKDAVEDPITGAKRKPRLSNIVFMGMGEPLANYRNVVEAIQRINDELGIGARKITVSTVGIVPNIRRLMNDPAVPQVRLAVSLHCADDESRSALLPANRRYGGLEELMTTLRDYIEQTGRRVTLEWALIEGQNDDVETARKLGRLIQRYRLRSDMVHVNVIPLNPTGGFAEGRPSQRSRVDAFCATLEQEFTIACTPRVRRGIDIDAGCGQLKAKVLEKEKRLLISLSEEPRVGVYEAIDEKLEAEVSNLRVWQGDDAEESLYEELSQLSSDTSFRATQIGVHFESDDYEDPELTDLEDQREASRLIALVTGTAIDSSILGDVKKPRNTSSRKPVSVRRSPSSGPGA